MTGAPDCFSKNCYKFTWREIIRNVCIAPITPRLSINRHAVFPLVFLQDTCQSNQFNICCAERLQTASNR